MTDVWSDRAEAYRESEAHREGADLDLLVAWAEGKTALDVATGGGHVARRLREAGYDVVTSDPAPGMKPDVICGAEDLPFADESFDVVVSRIAAHHFPDTAAALAEMARVSRHVVLIEDTLFDSERVEEAQQIRDPSHVRMYTEEGWLHLVAQAGLHVVAAEVLETRQPLEDWIARTGCTGEEAQRVRELISERVEGGVLHGTRIVVKARKQAV